MSVIGFLHTAPVHVSTFESLVAEYGASVESVASVDEALLHAARRDGLDDPAVRLGVSDAVADLHRRGADVVICTCSTIGGLAERAGTVLGVAVVRVDRPMAEEAVRLAAAGEGRIAVVAALTSTIAPTLELLESIAEDQSVAVDLEVVVSDGAWARFEAGDHDGYLDAVASSCAACAIGVDVIVLAQASMAGAASRLDRPMPVLSSPSSAVEAVIARLAVSPDREG